MDTFLLNAQRIFDVACAGSGADSSEFALLLRRDGGIHLIMEAEMTLDAVMAHNDASSAYYVRRSRDRVRVTGSDGSRHCELEESSHRDRWPGVFRDQPLYRIISPLLTSTSV